MAFLVEKEPGAITRPHFHQADQYQVVVHGGGKLGLHDAGPVTVHYTDAYSAYGPIVASEDGIWWFTLRNSWDPGAKYMPAERAELRAARSRFQHWEATLEPAPAAPVSELAGLVEVTPSMVFEDENGLATWRYRVPAGAVMNGPDPSTGGGQFWLVLSGSAATGGSAMMPPNSCIFVAPSDGSLKVDAGPHGAEMMCMQFRARAWH
jgi:hypothetical protein